MGQIKLATRCSDSNTFVIDLGASYSDQVYYLTFPSTLPDGCYDCVDTGATASYTASTVDSGHTTCQQCEAIYPTPTPTASVTTTPTPTVTPTNFVCQNDYCIYNTGLYDDTYTFSGYYNSYPYWYGSNSGLYIYFDTLGVQWCLSSSLGGYCLLSGKSPCTSLCPDLCDVYFTSGLCPTPTPTPTLPCDVDFEAIFDCDFTQTPTSTPTPTITPTQSVTPTPTDICVFSLDVTINNYSPTPTPTLTVTPTQSAPVVRPCNFSGDVTFNIINDIIKCPFSYQFQNCFTGEMYFTTNNIEVPISGVTLEEFMVFEASVNGNSQCISFVGINQNIIGVDDITLQYGPFGYSNLGDCNKCVPFVSPTPTPSSTMKPTPTPTITPSSSLPQNLYFVYSKCADNGQTLVVQTLPAITIEPGSVIKDEITGECWKFEYTTFNPNTIDPLTYNIINYTGNYLSNAGETIYANCLSCLQPATTTTTTGHVALSCTIPWVHYKTQCGITDGTISVNGIVVMTFNTALPVGISTGTISITAGDIIEFDFSANPPIPLVCPSVPPPNPTVELIIPTGTYTASYNGINSFTETFTVDSSWCLGGGITINSYSS